MTECPSEADLHRYHAKEMGEQEEARLREHLDQCTNCARRDAELVAAHDNLLGNLRRIDFQPPPETSPVTDCTETQPVASRTGQVRPTVSIEGYDILDELSHGGQGVVYRAVQKSTNREVAVKVLLEGAYASETARKRFQREIELAAQLQHPNIITIFDSGVTDDGLQYCVMDYVHGLPLHRFVRAKELVLDETLRLFSIVCDAIEYAHGRGIIHRDLKPSNILVNADGQPKILDFGLARTLAGPAGTVVSSSRDVMGTLPYMSPEQAQGRRDEVDARTDVYSLGISLYELLTGHFPYPVDGQMGDVIRHIVETPPAPPSRKWRSESGVKGKSSHRFRSGACPIGREVQTILFKALAKEPQRRYQSAAAFGGDVTRYLQHEPILARPPSVAYRLQKFVRKRWLPLIAVLILLIALGFAMYFRTRANRASTAIVMQTAQRLYSEALLESYRDPDKAIEKFDETIALMPDYLEAKIQRAFLLKRESRADQAIEAAQTILKQYPDSGAVHFLLSQLFLTRDPQLAAHHRQEGRRLLPNDKYYLAMSLDDNQADEAIELLSEVLNDDGGHFDARWARAWRYFQDRDFEAMLEDAKVLVALHAKLATAWNIQGLALGRLGRLSDSLAAYNRAIQLSPYYAFTYLNRADLYFKLLQPEKTIEDCNRSLSLQPDVSLAHALRARAHIRLGRYTRAEVDCRKALDLNNSDALAWRILGNIHARQHKIPDAQAAFSTAIELDPATAAGYNDRGQLFHQLRRYKEAIEDYTAGILRDDHNASLYNSRALALHNVGKIAEALADLSRAIELNPDFAASYHNRARLFRVQGDFDRALVDHDKAISLHASASYYSGRSVTRRSSGDTAGAIEDIEQVIALNPADRALFHLLSWEIYRLYPIAGGTSLASEALAAADRSASNPWEKTVVAHCMGNASEEDVLILADDNHARLCEAHHFLGVKALADRRRDVAAEWFRKNLALHLVDFPEYHLAKIHLAHLDAD
ncbi:MAG: protein kinase [Planctomycetes bacterium]|nr:protein kinase [Planctomycetota bacterium]